MINVIVLFAENVLLIYDSPHGLVSQVRDCSKRKVWEDPSEKQDLMPRYDNYQGFILKKGGGA